MHTHRWKTQRTCKRRRGAALVEAALVLPIVLLFLVGILEYSRYIMTLQVLTNAAREGAHYALSHSEPVTLQGVTYGNQTSDVLAIVNQRSGGTKLTSQTVTVFKSDSLGNNKGAWSDAAAGESICVRISGTYQFILPSLLKLPASQAVSIQSVMRSEGS